MADRTRYTGADAVSLFNDLKSKDAQNSEKQQDPKGIIINDMGDVLSNTAGNDRNPNVYMKEGKKFVFLGMMGGQVDINKIYTNILNANIAAAQKFGSFMRSKYFDFKEHVQGRGVWDYKNNINTIFGIANRRFENRTQFTFFNQTMTAQDIGNHHYGVVGSAAGISEEFLLLQAGSTQILSNTSSPSWQQWEVEPYTTGDGIMVPGVLYPPYGDDPNDQLMIKKGVALYNLWNNTIKP
jgi:hypothetical protein